jgi:hypothetical protein
LIGYQDNHDVNDHANYYNDLDSDLSFDYESGIDYSINNNNEFSEEQSPSNSSEGYGDIVESLNRLSINKVDEKEDETPKQIKQSEQPEQTEQSDSSMTVLALVNAKKKDRKGNPYLFILFFILFI